LVDLEGRPVQVSLRLRLLRSLAAPLSGFFALDHHPLSLQGSVKAKHSWFEVVRVQGRPPFQLSEVHAETQLLLECQSWVRGVWSKAVEQLAQKPALRGVEVVAEHS
jgi:hypothetical protein